MESALYKDLKNGSYLCNVCTSQVKSKVWTAHSNSRKHRENAQKLKLMLLAKENQKRKHLEDKSDEVNAKKIRENDRRLSNNEMEIEMDIALSNNKRPWQTEVQESSTSSRNGSNSVSSVKIIEGLPQGFFDNEEMNSRVCDTMEKQKNLDFEVDKFFREIANEEEKKEEEDDVEAKATAMNNDIELIDEQIARWQTVNELEKKKEEVVESIVRNPNFNRSVVARTDAENDDDDDDDDFEFYSLSWRTKVL